MKEKPNNLINEKSPYLLQHAFNPVNWNAWNNETIQLAKTLDKPIFLSIGYSTCYWCHVMERECFENHDIAALMNETFVNIKVDREEMPDIDRIYMSALQSMTGSGGWPMSMFLTPDLKPFYGATYIPPKSKYGRAGIEDIINQIGNLWNNKRNELINSSENITRVLDNNNQSERKKLDDTIFDSAYVQCLNLFDEEYGGFGSGNKFPRPVILDYLLKYYYHTKEIKALDMVTYTLKKMYEGGIFDNIDKGFHRYSVDKYWRVPHFEKMLYDQAQISNTYFDAYSLTQEQSFLDAGNDTLQYVMDFLVDSKGGFYSAEDAESAISFENLNEKQEGFFYLWEKDEINSIAPKEYAHLFNEYFGVVHKGNTISDPHNIFGTTNVLYKTDDLYEVAKRNNISINKAEVIIKETLALLKKQREKRPRPFLDKKILTTWNSLMISSFVKGYMVTGNEDYKKTAVRAVSFLINNLYKEGEDKLYHRYIDGEVKFDGGLDDYAFLIKALLDFHNISFSGKLLTIAKKLTEQAIIKLYDEENGGFFDSEKRIDVILQTKEIYDGAEPSGNSVMADNLTRLFAIFKDDRYYKLAEESYESFYSKAESSPFSSPYFLSSLFNFLKYNTSIILSGNLRSELFIELHSAVMKKYLPNKNLIYFNNISAKLIPYLNDIVKDADSEKVFVCENFTCNLPVSTTNELNNLLNKIRK
ncbi:MAG: thioredoxin domain-containing protein [Candidatus Kapaibacterium sp.]